MSTPTLTQLKQALSIAEQIEKLKAEFAALAGGTSPAAPQKAAAAPASPAAKSGRRKLSPQALANIRAAQKARWAKVRAGAAAPAKAPAAAPNVAAKSAPAAKAKGKRSLSPEARAKMSAAAKKRWAKAK